MQYICSLLIFCSLFPLSVKYHSFSQIQNHDIGKDNQRP
jgi:hypothetical protein